MNIAIIISKSVADQNIKKHLNFEKFKNLKIYNINEESIYCENLDLKINADLFVFATKHKSKSEIPSLTCHTPGNWGSADFGGENNKLCKSPAFYLKQFYLELKKYEKKIDSTITLEVTHHGPYLEKPCMFVEIGSSEKQWNDDKFGEIIASCIKKTFVKNFKTIETCILLGGTHYNSAANKIMERTDLAVGHICPKHSLKFLNERLLKEAIEKTIPKANLILLDWKGLGKYKKKINKLIKKVNVKSERVKNILKTNPKVNS